MAENQKSRVHVKLLSFLKKTLNEKENRRICPETCEPCMLAKEENSQVGQKFVFLTTSFLYQVDYKLKNNPKVLCLLEDIVSVKQTNALPGFLSKEDGEKTVHVQIKHRRRVPVESTSVLHSWSPRFMKKMMNRSDSKQLKSSSESVTSEESGDVSLCTSGSCSLDSSDAVSVVKPESLRQLPLGNHGNHDPLMSTQQVQKPSQPSQSGDVRLKSPTSSPSPVNRLGFSTGDNDQRPSSSPAVHSRSPPGTINLTSHTSPRSSLSPLCHSRVSGEGDGKKGGLSPVATRGSLPPVATRGSLSPIIAKGGPLHHTTPGLSASLMQTNRSLSSIHCKSSSQLQSSSPLLSNSEWKKSRSMDFAKFSGDSLYGSPLSSLRSGSLMSVGSSTYGSSTSLDQELTGGEGCEVTDLYILNTKSNFHHHLVMAWEERLVAMLTQQFESGISPSNHMKSLDTLRMQYQRLQQELLGSSSLEETAELLNELLTACQRFPELKQFFWEDITMLEFCLHLIEMHLPATPATMATNGKTPVHRADQLELCVVTVSLLYHVMCEICCSGQRIAQLRKGRSQRIEALVNVAMISFVLPKEKRPVSASQRDEIEKLHSELVDRITCLLSQTAKTVRQSQWVSRDKSNLNLCWYTSLLAEHKNTEDFFHRIVSRFSSLAKSKELSLEEVLAVHHTVHLLSTLCTNSKRLLALFKEKFCEEIKYFFRASVFARLIPENVLIKQKIMDGLQELKVLVLS